ncbi:MAG: hypothetical protein ACJ8ED_16485, partial [Xanthobacteraceae bacterium]
APPRKRSRSKSGSAVPFAATAAASGLPDQDAPQLAPDTNAAFGLADASLVGKAGEPLLRLVQ